MIARAQGQADRAAAERIAVEIRASARKLAQWQWPRSTPRSPQCHCIRAIAVREAPIAVASPNATIVVCDAAGKDTPAKAKVWPTR